MQPISMQSRLTYSLCVLGVALGILVACSAPDASDVLSNVPGPDNELATEEQAAAADKADAIRIHRLNMQVSNVYLIESADSLVLVDAGMPFSDRIIVPRIEDFADKPLRLIFITHAHLDHYGGAAAVREKTGAPIAIHPADAQSMIEGKTPLGSIRDWDWVEPTMPLVEQWAQAPLSPTEPDVLLEDGDDLRAWGLTDAVVIHTPGHTPGSTTLLVDGKHALVGDLIATTGEARAQRTYADNWDELAASLRRVQEMEPEIVYPGHGPPLTQVEILKTLRAQYVLDPDEADATPVQDESSEEETDQ